LVDISSMVKASHNTPQTPLLVSPQTTRRWGWRSYAKFALSWVLVISVGRFVIPTSSNASPAAKGAGDSPDLGPKIGTIVGPGYRVQINAGIADPLYTVLSSDGATTLGRGLNAVQLAQKFPSLDPARLNATPVDASVDPMSHAGGPE